MFSLIPEGLSCQLHAVSCAEAELGGCLESCPVSLAQTGEQVGQGQALSTQEALLRLLQQQAALAAPSSAHSLSRHD